MRDKRWQWVIIAMVTAVLGIVAIMKFPHIKIIWKDITVIFEGEGFTEKNLDKKPQKPVISPSLQESLRVKDSDRKPGTATPVTKTKNLSATQRNVIIETEGKGSDILETLLSQKLMEAGYNVHNSTSKETLSLTDLRLVTKTQIEFSQDNMGIKSYRAVATLTLSQFSNNEKIFSVNNTETIFGLDEQQAVMGEKENQFTKKLAEPLVAEFLKKLATYPLPAIVGRK